MEKAFVVQRVARKLFATERALDTTMTETAELMAEFVKARQDLKLSAVVGDAATAKVIEALAALGEARTAIVAAHAELNDVRLRIGVRTKMTGWEEKPPELSAPQADSTLRQVS